MMICKFKVVTSNIKLIGIGICFINGDYSWSSSQQQAACSFFSSSHLSPYPLPNNDTSWKYRSVSRLSTARFLLARFFLNMKIPHQTTSRLAGSEERKENGMTEHDTKRRVLIASTWYSTYCTSSPSFTLDLCGNSGLHIPCK